MARARQKHVVRHLMYGYLLVIILSLTLSDFPFLEQIAVVVWLLISGYILWALGKTQDSSLGAILFTGFMFQWPGYVAVLCSLWSVYYDSTFQWANGILELWVYPFLSFIELLPTTKIGGLSDVYISACVLPFLLTGFWVIVRCWGKIRSRRSLRPS